MAQLISTTGTTDLRAIPFAYEVLDADWTSYHDIQGLIRLDGPMLVIEIQQQLFRFNKKVETDDTKQGHSTTTVQLPINDIERLQLIRRWFSLSLHLQVKRLALLADIPGAKAGEMSFKIAGRHRQDAQALVSRAMLIRSELLAMG